MKRTLKPSLTLLLTLTLTACWQPNQPAPVATAPAGTAAQQGEEGEETGVQALAVGDTLYFRNFGDFNVSDWNGDGGGWSVLPADPAKEQEYCQTQEATALNLAGDASWKDYSVSGKVRVKGTSGSVALLARVQNGDNYYALELKQDGGAKKWFLYQNRGGSFSELASGGYDWPSDQNVYLKLTARGDKLSASASLDNTSWTSLGSASDGTFLQGKIGLRTSNTSACFDTVRVSSENAPYTGSAQAGDKTYPDDAVINVKTRYGAIPDDGKDDTAAIQTAISDNVASKRTLYFPSGTYNVSNSLMWRRANGIWGASLRVQGQNRDRTIIKLADGAFGGDQKAVIYTASNGAFSDGGGVRGFENHISDLTIDTGRGNPGAVGIDYVATNCAAIRNVTIRSGDGSGRAGLGLLRTYPGPLLVQHVRVEGFNYGVQVEHDEYAQTFEDLTLTNQRIAGIFNRHNVLNIHDLTSNNSVPAIQNVLFDAVTTLTGAKLTGGSSAVSAIDNNGVLYARDVTSSGYASAVKNDGATVPGANLGEYSSDPRVDRNALSASFRLSDEATPEFHDNNLNNWASVTDFGAKPNDYSDDSDAIQNAIDSGKTTVYFPPGIYRIGKTIHLRANLRRVLGTGAHMEIATATQAFANSGNPQPVFRLDDGSADTVAVDGLFIAHYNTAANFAGGVWFEQASSRTMVLRDIDQMGDGNTMFRNTSGAGKLFIENVASVIPWRFDSPQDVWARQWNPENHNAPITDTLITKNGGKLWILGLKTEDPRTVLKATAGAQVELLGGLIYPNDSVPVDRPAFIGEDAKLKLTYTTLQYNRPDYQVHVREVNSGVTTTLQRSNISVVNHHAAVALYLGAGAAPTDNAGGQGLTAAYYDNAYGKGGADFTALKTTRTDPTINFNWGYGIPSDTGLTAPDFFSVRWTGRIEAPTSGTYTFTASADDRVTLWIGGRQVLSRSGGMGTTSGTIDLRQGQKYDVKVEYAEYGNTASAKLAWSVDNSVPQLIPPSQLFPDL